MRERPVVFCVEGTLPIAYNASLRMHWAKRRELARDFTWLMKASITKEDINILKAWRDLGHKLHISMEVYTQQLYDDDNLVSLGKIPLDAMKSMQWIKDDGPKFVKFDATEKLGAKRVIFTIRPLPLQGES